MPITLFVGTDKGLFRCRSSGRAQAFRIEPPQIEGHRILDVCRIPGTARDLIAAAAHDVWGTHLYASSDGGDSWESLAAVPHRPGTGELNAVWSLAFTPDGRTLYAGVDPAGLFVSHDRGATWEFVASLSDHPTASAWEPSRGLFAVHSICIDAHEPRRLVVAVSAGGVYRTEDGGASWLPANRGVRAENLPNRHPIAGHNVHRVVMHPHLTRRLYRQCYNGTYRSDDGGEHWTEITHGLPADFGYALATDPNDPDTVFQIPESGSHLRTTADGKLRVFRSRDAGRTWASASQGLPAGGAWVTVLRRAIDVDRRSPCGVYFGTSSGHVFASDDAADHWYLAAEFLPRVLSVTAIEDGT